MNPILLYMVNMLSLPILLHFFIVQTFIEEDFGVFVVTEKCDQSIGRIHLKILLCERYPTANIFDDISNLISWSIQVFFNSFNVSILIGGY